MQARWTAAAADPATRTFIALSDDEPVGAACVCEEWLEGLYVVPERWGTGLADVLHDRALEVVRDLGSERCHLWVLEDNARARRFYERRGWRENGEIAGRRVPAEPARRGLHARLLDWRDDEESALCTQPDGLAPCRERPEPPLPTATSATTSCCGSMTPTRRATSPAARRRSCATWSGSASTGTKGRSGRASARIAYRAAAERLGGDRFGRITLLREDGTATYHLASVVDDIDFGITHVIRGNDHRPNESLHRELTEALGAKPPEYIHLGLILGEDGRKLSKREFGATVASLRDAGIPAEAVRSYLDELGIPKHDVHYDVVADPPARDRGDRGHGRRGAGRPRSARRSSSFQRSAAPATCSRRVSSRASSSSRRRSRSATTRGRRSSASRSCARTAARRKDIVRELKAVGGDLRALRLALTGRERGPELWAVSPRCPSDEALRRVDAAL